MSSKTVSKRKLVSSPDGLDATCVECPTCGASVGWACGQAHCDGYHPNRIARAKLAIETFHRTMPETAKRLTVLLERFKETNWHIRREIAEVVRCAIVESRDDALREVREKFQGIVAHAKPVLITDYLERQSQ